MWLKPQGYATITSPVQTQANLDGFQAEQVQVGVSEYDTFTCGHCCRVTHVKSRSRPEDIGGLCKQCMKLICPYCLNTGRCDPFEKKLERAEERQRILHSYGL